MLVVDFETFAIDLNPSYAPPRPIGVALKQDNLESRYYDFTKTEDYETARHIIGTAINYREQLLFHNSMFDIAVMERHMDLFPLPTQIEDTLFMLFLHDPYASTYSLKPSAEKILGWPPEERDLVKEWILAHIKCKPSQWAAHICEAPVELVAPYACGDVDRTYALYMYLKNRIPFAPYQREIMLRPILQKAERLGIKVNWPKLSKDVGIYATALLEADRRLHNILGVGNLDSADELADMLERAGHGTGHWPRTPTGQRSTTQDALAKVIESQPLSELLIYRNALAHCYSNFLKPWLEHTEAYGGRIHPRWNQTRGDKAGTRTGRLSCSEPNMQNVPNDYDIVIPNGLIALPSMREYLIPDDGYVWLKRDYSQQELRILAHFSEGKLFDRYQENPRIDAHEETQKLIKEMTGIELERKAVKILGFSMIYGAGLNRLSDSLEIPRESAQDVRNAYFKTLPEIKELMRDCSNAGRAGMPLTTWGGRKYFVEQPKLSPKGTMQSFEYRLLNYLIQGSAADCTKEAIVRWGTLGMRDERFLTTVHDEINIQVPIDRAEKYMDHLREAMESVEFDVKMLTDGFKGNSWANLEAVS